ncbi:hypothetical protein [Thauera humireducens]|uniref:hypothetical protein n=1 Tax=Thauera humireducens TaxID=1134435 RepID=UPI00311EEFAA
MPRLCVDSHNAIVHGPVIRFQWHGIPAKRSSPRSGSGLTTIVASIAKRSLTRARLSAPSAGRCWLRHGCAPFWGVMTRVKHPSPPWLMMGDGGRHALEDFQAADGGFNQFQGAHGDRGLLPGGQVVFDDLAASSRAGVADQLEGLHAGEACGARGAAVCCREHTALGRQRVALRLACNGGAHGRVTDKGDVPSRRIS